MRATKTTIRFKLSRAEDARALEYLRDRKAAGSSFSKSVVQAINDCLDAQETESREDSFLGRFRMMLREELKGVGKYSSFSVRLGAAPAVAGERRANAGVFGCFRRHGISERWHFSGETPSFCKA